MNYIIDVFVHSDMLSFLRLSLVIEMFLHVSLMFCFVFLIHTVILINFFWTHDQPQHFLPCNSLEKISVWHLQLQMSAHYVKIK